MISPTKMGMDLYNKGKRKLHRIFDEKPKDANEDN